MERLLLDVNAVGEKVDSEFILLSKLSANKETNFSDYIIKRHGDKFAQCPKCEILKRLWIHYDWDRVLRCTSIE